MIDPNGLKIAVLDGGISTERQISLNSGREVVTALRAQGCEVEELDIADLSFIDNLKNGRFDIAFLALHGKNGEDGNIQGLLEILNVPYIGSGVLASALAMDKARAKVAFGHAGLDIARSLVLKKGDAYDVAEIVEKVGAELIAKPVSDGSSFGMSVSHNVGELKSVIDLAFTVGDVVMLEEFTHGKEITVSVIGNDDPYALPIIEIAPHSEFYDFDEKYSDADDIHILPARINEEQTKHACEVAITAHKCLGCAGLSRCDMIITDDGRYVVLEVNTIPGMTKTSLLPDAARYKGIPFGELCMKIVSLALEC